MKITLFSLLLLPLFLKAQTTTLTVGGKTRTLFVYAPSGLPQNRPLVISMHGLNQDINYQKGQAKWELVADTAKFVVVYPAGENNSWDINGTKDTDFILAIIESMVTRFGIDRNRVYVSGFSMGGMMSYHVANKIADKVAAIGPVSGYLFSNTTASTRPMPIVHVHGMADDVVHYEPYTNQQGVVAMLQKWRSWNKCPATGTLVKPFPANGNNGNSYEYWGPCDKSAVVLISLAGKGHWHSNEPAGVYTTVELWKFLKKYSLAGSSSVTITSPVPNAVYIAPASVTIAATATLQSGTISKMEFYNGSIKLGEDASSPYSYTWMNVAAGVYAITAVATDNAGKRSTSDPIVLKVSIPQGPYTTAHAIPGRIEAEHYDVGGEGVAFHETNTNGNEGGATLRNDEVDIETTSDASGTYNVGYILKGEWLEYTVEVANSGKYNLDLRVAADGSGKLLHVEIDDADVSGAIAIPNTGGWQTWETIVAKDIDLTQGKHVMRIAFDADYLNLNYFEFKPMILTSQREDVGWITSISPNPFLNQGFLIKHPADFQYRITNANGMLLESGQGKEERLVGGELLPGIYFCTLETRNGVATYKVLKRE